MRSIRNDVLACVLLPVAITAIGCASQPTPPTPVMGYAADGAVGAEQVDDDASTVRYQQAAGSSYLDPVPSKGNSLPVYPAEFLARRLPAVTVVVRLIVDPAGKVSDARILDNAAGEQAFADAVEHAVRSWTFLPLQRVTGRQVQSLPFTEDYRFTFRQENGRAVVEGE